MSTAEEIVDNYYKPNMHWISVNRNEIIKAINEARKEVEQFEKGEKVPMSFTKFLKTLF